MGAWRNPTNVRSRTKDSSIGNKDPKCALLNKQIRGNQQLEQ